MKKRIVLIIFIFFMFCIGVKAEDKSLEQQFIDNTGSGLDESVTDQAKQFFDDNDISIEDASNFTNISIKDVVLYIFNQAKDNVGEPLKLLGILIAVILLIAIIESLGIEQMSSLSKIFDIIGVLVCVGIMYKYISNCIQLTSQTLQDGSSFMLCYVPVFASVVGASGSLTSAGVYNVAVLTVAEVAVQIAYNILMPMLGIFLALSIIEAINPGLSLSGFTSGIKKGIQWTLGFIMTIFVGLITIQSIVGTSADNIGIRVAKFAASSFIPVIGSAISEAYTTVKGSLGLLRSGVGTFGIVVLLLTILPPLISVIAIKISVSIASFVGELLGVKKVTLLLKNTSSVLSIAISLLTCFALMLIVSTAIIMMVGLNIA